MHRTALSAAAAAVLLVSSTEAAQQKLQPRLQPLGVGSVTPSGWLLKQLEIQAEGLSGHLADFWPDVMDSIWIGGTHDMALYERTPYWLNGIVPLSFLLANAGKADTLNHPHGGAGDDKLNITAQVDKYLDYILAHQDTDGWLGPKKPFNGDMYWPPSNVMQALYQYAEGKSGGDRTHPLIQTMGSKILAHLKCAAVFMKTNPQGNWAASRWEDISLTAEWLLDWAPQGEEKFLFGLLDTLQKTGSDWEGFFDQIRPGHQAYPSFPFGHNVNLAQALKSSSVIHRYNASYTKNNKTTYELTVGRMHNMDDTFGLPTGMFNGDEHLPTPPTRSPSRGIELCGVVESMFSYTVMYSVFGNEIAFADRVELIAYNALPATWASPKGGDMWAHQYLQAVNEVNAINANPHTWQTDGPLAETYGLAPNYGCCTANFNQGWPKLASNLFFVAPEGALVVGLYAPALGRFPGGHTIDVVTSYPFEDLVEITVDPKSSVEVWLRIPGWATTAEVDGHAVKNGTYFKVTVSEKTTYTLDMKAQVRVAEWDAGAVSVHHGSLMYSLPIAPAYEIYGRHYQNESNDYYLTPTSPWQYALDIDMQDPSSSLTFHKTGYQPGSAPFNHSGWPTSITGTIRPLPGWNMTKNSASNPPQSPACATAASCGHPLKMHLVPHGGTELRIGQFPRSGQ